MAAVSFVDKNGNGYDDNAEKQGYAVTKKGFEAFSNKQTDKAGNAQVTSESFTDAALKSQEDMLKKSLELNTAMAWLQMALGIVGKIAGR